MTNKPKHGLLGCCLLVAPLAAFANAECPDVNSLQVRSVPATTKQQNFLLTATKTAVTQEDLNEIEFKLKTYQVTKEGTLTHVAGKISDKNSTYKTVYAFNQYKTASDNKRYGVSIRLELDYRANKADVSVANLFGIFGVDGGSDKLDGTISMSIHGMKNPKAAYILPVPTKIDDTSATQFLNYMSFLKNMIGEANSIDPVELPTCI